MRTSTLHPQIHPCLLGSGRSSSEQSDCMQLPSTALECTAVLGWLVRMICALAGCNHWVCCDDWEVCWENWKERWLLILDRGDLGRPASWSCWYRPAEADWGRYMATPSEVGLTRYCGPRRNGDGGGLKW